MRGWLDQLGNLQLIGRNGQHRYNNADHSMMTGVLAARNLAGEEHDIWSVNVEQDYHEEQSDSEQQAEAAAVAHDFEELFGEVFARYNAVALGLALALVLGLGLFVATAVLLLNGREPIGPNLSLIGSYFFGYSVTWSGAIVGFFEAGLLGFAFGWLLAKMINLIVAREESHLRQHVENTLAMNAFQGEEA